MFRRGPISVAALVREVGELLAGRFSVCAVRGEISGFSRASSGHCYFNLKDADGGSALLRCAMFRRTASLLDFTPREGQLVEIRGRLGVYEPRGELQVVAEAMQIAGAGALYEQFLRTKARLDAQGFFGAERRRRLPAYPRALGIVASLDSAALHDVLTALSRRVPHVHVVVYPSVVQGAAAPTALVEAIALASRRSEVDTLIVCRGGGSLEDLWAFNDESVVRAIAGCSVPVVCGVGHETDMTLADLAADLRTPTPTAAAELAATTREACLDLLDAFTELFRKRVQDALDIQAQRLDRSAARLARPARALRRQGERIALIAHRLTSQLPLVSRAHRAWLTRSEVDLRKVVHLRLSVNVSRVDGLEARLRALDPQQVLARGYAWLGDHSGRPVTSAGQLVKGSTLEAVLHDGSAKVLVTEVKRRTIG